MQNEGGGGEIIFFVTTAIKKNWVGPNFGGSVGQQQTNLFLFLALLNKRNVHNIDKNFVSSQRGTIIIQ